MNFIQNPLELLPAGMIGLGNIENDGRTLDFSFGTRCCVLGVIPQRVTGRRKLTDFFGDGLQGGFVPGDYQHVEPLLSQLNCIFSSNPV